jgi:hypothetical protein
MVGPAVVCINVNISFQGEQPVMVMLGERAAHYSPTCDGPIAKISSHYWLLALETYIAISQLLFAEPKSSSFESVPNY